MMIFVWTTWPAFGNASSSTRLNTLNALPLHVRPRSLSLDQHNLFSSCQLLLCTFPPRPTSGGQRQRVKYSYKRLRQ